MRHLAQTLLALCLACVCASAQTFRFGTAADPKGKTLTVDSKSLLLDGRRILPVMGEIHYSRVPRQDWHREILKMKAGGVDIISCYVFWNHHEYEEGVFDWSGNRDLRAFLRICRDCGEMVVLRVGPFCHGEAYLGGIPEWMVDKAAADPDNYRLRTMAPGFIEAVGRLYMEIGRQAEGLLWKDGGPVVGLQVDNESRGPWPYLATLKQKAVDAGFDLPFYTRTGWPEMSGPAVFGELLPLYGDYADGFWDRDTTDMPGDYRKAFTFSQSRLSKVIATEVFGRDTTSTPSAEDLSYPYLTCELGGGMMTSYHRRVHIFDNDALALEICKLGSGSNLPGFYMYHGGANPRIEDQPGAELQDSKYTNHNDLPHVTYDFQAPLGEMGQPNPSYHKLRLLHQMLRDWGEELAGMDPEIGDGPLRTSVRSKDGSGFVFVCNYERMASLGERTLHFQGQDIEVPDGASFCFPFGLRFRRTRIDWATAQPFCKLRHAVYFTAVEGIPAKLCINGKVYEPALDKPFTVKGVRFVVMSPEKALTAYKISHFKVVFFDGIVYRAEGRKLVFESWKREGTAQAHQIRKARPAREVTCGRAGVPEQPSEDDFRQAAVWEPELPDFARTPNYFLEVRYKGDCARVYADSVLVEDNFWNGRPMLVRASDIAGKKVRIAILPMRKDTPVYLQKEQRETLEACDGETMLSLDGIEIIHRTSE